MTYLDTAVKMEFATNLLSGTFHNNRLFAFYFRNGLFLYNPMYSFDLEPMFQTLDLVHTAEQAEIYRWALLDESIPVLDESIFGRLTMAHYLGLLGYEKAAPEMRELMLHAPEYEMRAEGAEALGSIGTNFYVDDLIGALKNDSDSHVRLHVARALGMIKDKRALRPLREMYEQSAARVHLTDLGIEWIKVEDSWDEIIVSLRAMLAMGGQLAEDTYQEAFNSPNVHVYEAAKRARPIIKVPTKREVQIFQ